MTTYEQANELMSQLFVSTWQPTGHAFQIENKRFNRPTNAPWARFSIRPNDGAQGTLGPIGTSRRFDREGDAVVQIFVPQKTGTRVTNQLVGVIVDAFEGARIAGSTVRFPSAIVRTIGQDGNWFQTNVEIQFQFDIRK